ncbi:baculoviral IAP repeat-containing protein 1e-like [Apodemus sylvaticus]|uniref:baculoviral IAP repeat-containing protein 1e-like n=1 Tax=Apodemus sylvaticus TaxID=10129 RepID=UPI002244C4C8|nr:baculoviral IAP repeat-containing protein 1e-like [Apodemus sylvaticus]
MVTMRTPDPHQDQHIPDKITSEKFAQALGSLRNLEELLLPSGDGTHQVAKLIVQQCLQLPCLRVLAFHHILDDDSVIEIGWQPEEVSRNLRS